MKNLALLTTIVALLSGCNEITKKIERTSQTPQKVQFEFSVPQSKEAYNCESIEVYGPDRSCGMSERVETCGYDYMNGHDVCRSEYISPSCQHTETNCDYRERAPLIVKAAVIFDTNSGLSQNEKETYTFKARIDGNNVVVKTSVKSKYYQYSFPQQVIKNIYQLKSDEVQIIEFKKIN